LAFKGINEKNNRSIYFAFKKALKNHSNLFIVNKSNQQLDALQKELHKAHQSREEYVKEPKHDEERKDPVCITKECVTAGKRFNDNVFSQI